MSRIRHFPVPAMLALLVTASLAHGQGSTPAATASAPHDKAHMTAKHAMTPKIDLNHATREQLMTLPGVGEATADKIIAARPFKSKSELTSKNILTKKEYEAISKRVIAKEEKMAGETGK